MSSDLTPAIWREIEKESVNQWIYLGKLRTILRKSRRTNDQNALLWALYEDVLSKGGETLGGWTKNDLHEHFLGEHFGWEIREALGRKKQVPRHRSSRLTKAEFSDFLESVVRKCAEYGIVLELPGEIAA
jgi:hypothetical protein